MWLSFTSRPETTRYEGLNVKEKNVAQISSCKQFTKKLPSLEGAFQKPVVPEYHGTCPGALTNHAQPIALEKVPAAAVRMACSTVHAYREIKAGRLGPLVKLGARASALPSASVDAWILAKISEAGGK